MSQSQATCQAATPRGQDHIKNDQQRIHELIKNEPPMQVQTDQELMNVINFQVINSEKY